MAFLQVSAYSNVLEMEVNVNVILPQTTVKKIGTQTEGLVADVPVLYLLHGMGGNHSVWERRSSIERYVAQYQLAVVMPSGDLGFYTDTTYDMPYWTYLSEELPQIIHELFPQLTTKREKTFAAGLSMGGYGALKLGLKKPENFAAVASLSGALQIGEEVESLLQLRKAAFWEGIFGPLEQIKGSANDPDFLLEALVASGKPQPRFFLACGEQDFLYSASEGMAEKMAAKGVDVTFEHGMGVHDWQFWDQWIQRALTWFAIPTNN